MRRIIPLGLLLASLTWTVPAQAGTVVPPGNSGINQYVETFPGVGGGVTVHHHKQGHNSAVAPRTRQALTSLGSNGQGAAAAADATAATVTASPSSSSTGAGPTTKSGPARGSGHTAKGSRVKAGSSQPAPAAASPPAAGGGSPFGALARAVTSGASGQGMGPAQPIILLLVLLGAGAYVWRKRGRNA